MKRSLLIPQLGPEQAGKRLITSVALRLAHFHVRQNASQQLCGSAVGVLGLARRAAPHGERVPTGEGFVCFSLQGKHTQHLQQLTRLR